MRLGQVCRLLRVQVASPRMRQRCRALPTKASPGAASTSGVVMGPVDLKLEWPLNYFGTAAAAPAPPAPTADPETIRHIEAALGPLERKPLAPPCKPVVIVISGPSGVGKDAVLLHLKAVRPDLYFVVTATSRKMRPGEVDGKDYFFVTKGKFEEWREQNMLLEHALVYGEYKGIPRQQVDEALAAGTDVVLRIDVQGAATVKQLLPDIISIFITAETEEVLVKRLVSRKTEDLDRMLVRVQTAREETHHIPKFDYVVVNRDGRLDECVAEIASIIDAEKLRVTRRLA